MYKELKFTNFTPVEYGIVPTNIKENNDLSIILKNLCDNFEMSSIERKDTTSKTEHAAMLADIYFSSTEGKNDLYSLQDIANKLAISFTRAFELIQDHIHPRINSLVNKIDAVAKTHTDKALGYEDDQGNIKSTAPKLYLLDVAELYTKYNSTANDFVTHLCDKYHYNVQYLNDTNVTGLLNRIEPTNTIDIDNNILLSILQDVEIKIVSSGDGDVVIDTNQPDDVETDGATKHDIIEDDQTSSSTDDDNETDPLLDDDEGDVNVNIDTGDDSANINVNINGEVITTEEKELTAKLVKACFNANAFDQLRKELFAPKGSVNYKHLQSSLFIVRNPIRNILEDTASKYLTDLQMSMLRSNFSAMTELQMSGVIYLDIMAVPFSDKIIIGPNLLNKNLVNKAKSEGINIYPLIHKYLRANHNTNEDDLYYEYVGHAKIMKGITYTDLLAASYDVSQKLTNAKELSRTKYSNLINTARASAYRKVMTDYVRKLSESSSEDMLKVPSNNKQQFIAECDNFINKTAELISKDSQANVEDMLYELLLDRWYQGTIVGDIYRNFQERVKSAATTGNVDDTQLAMIKAQVIATIGSKFLFKNFI